MPRIRIRRLSSASLSLPLLFSTYVLLIVTVPFCLIYSIDVRTEAWHRLPRVEAGIPVLKWHGVNSVSEPWAGMARIEVDLFRREGQTALSLRGKIYEIKGEFDPEKGSCIRMSFGLNGNLEDLGIRLESQRNYIQARWNLPNRSDSANPLSALLRIDRDVPMSDVERVVDTIENAGISEIGYAGWRAKNP